MSDIRVGLVGFGYAGQTFHAPLIRATPGLELVSVVSSQPDRVQSLLGDGVRVESLDAMLAGGVDLVVVAAPNDLHHPMAMQALRAGCHVVVDKPMVLDLQQGIELVQESWERGRILSVFHNRRWDSDFLTLVRELRTERLGRPVEFVSHFDRFRPQVRERWREGDGPGAGLWLDLGSHLIDQTLKLFGRPDAIWLDLGRLRQGARSDDWFHAVLRWDQGRFSGLRAQLHASTLAACPGSRFTLHGTAGSFSVDGLDPQEAVLKCGPGSRQLISDEWGRDERRASLWLAVDEGNVRADVVRLNRGAYPRYYAQLRDALRGTAENPVPVGEALAVQVLLDAGRTSALDRKEVRLEPEWLMLDDLLQSGPGREPPTVASQT